MEAGILALYRWARDKCMADGPFESIQGFTTCTVQADGVHQRCSRRAGEVICMYYYLIDSNSR